MKRYPLIIRQGDALTKPFRKRYATGPNAGQVIDYLDHGVTIARLQVRDRPTSDGGTILLDLSTANGGIVLGKYDDGTGKEWSGYLYAAPSAIANLIPWGDAGYQLKVATQEGAWVKTLFADRAFLIPASTTMEDWAWT